MPDLLPLPTILMSILVPRDIPMNCFGVESIVTFIAPTFVNDKPVERTARFADNDLGLMEHKKAEESAPGNDSTSNDWLH